MVCAHSITLSNGVDFVHALVRDAYRRSLVIGVTNSVGGLALGALAYTYDALNRPVSRNADTFAYNERGEVVFSRRSATGAADAYAYDDIGNLLSDGGRNLLLRRLGPRRGARRLRERQDYYACRFYLPALIRWFFRRVRASAKVLKSPP